MWIALVKVEFDGIEVIIQYMFNGKRSMRYRIDFSN